jgi:hypothetical protein
LRRRCIFRFIQALGQGAPEIIDLQLGMGLACTALRQLHCQTFLAGAAIAVHAEISQGVAGVEHGFHRVQPIAFLAFSDIAARKDQVIDDGRGICPHAKEVIALEKAVVAVGRMGNHQGLHGRGVFFHQVADAGVGVDDDFIGQPHVAAAVALVGGNELLSIAPMPVVDGHAHTGIGVHHLFGGDDFQLVGIGVQAEALRRIANHVVVLLDDVKRPVTGVGQRVAGPWRCWQGLLQRVARPAFPGRRNASDIIHVPVFGRATTDTGERRVHALAPSFLNRSRKMG